MCLIISETPGMLCFSLQLHDLHVTGIIALVWQVGKLRHEVP